MENAIIIIVLAVILAFAIGYIVRAKKKGAKCIGCPNKNCSGNCCSAKK
ncbi:MAG: FeoB-associated Cys-rich membrane protein [Clostridia bacterium]|nr:FeoB-associated Cys-rich membrane protein [Clostridia bacterium]